MSVRSGDARLEYARALRQGGGWRRTPHCRRGQRTAEIGDLRIHEITTPSSCESRACSAASQAESARRRLMRTSCLIRADSISATQRYRESRRSQSAARVGGARSARDCRRDRALGCGDRGSFASRVYPATFFIAARQAGCLARGVAVGGSCRYPTHNSAQRFLDSSSITRVHPVVNFLREAYLEYTAHARVGRFRNQARS